MRVVSLSLECIAYWNDQQEYGCHQTMTDDGRKMREMLCPEKTSIEEMGRNILPYENTRILNLFVGLV